MTNPRQLGNPPRRMHIVERRSDGWAPSMSTIYRVLRIAKSKGFRTDWNFCGVLETGALSFGDISHAEPQTDLIAMKVSGKYEFMTDREYWERGQ